MRLCLACSAPLNHNDWICGCGYQPPSREGFLLFAENLLGNVTGFDAALFAQMAELEAKHFWFRERNKIIQWALANTFSNTGSFLEIGCGTGFVLRGLREAFPDLTLAGSEIFPEGLSFSAKNIPGVELWQMDARHLPFREEFDVIGAFDVLEHIDEDEAVLAQMHQAVKPGGGILITVPQHQWLWSEADARVHHVRRYSRQDLLAKVARAGFEIARVTSFVSLLLPFMALSRLRQRRIETDGTLHEQWDECAELKIHPVLNTCFQGVMQVERKLIQAGCSFPAGGSLLVSAHKR